MNPFIKQLNKYWHTAHVKIDGMSLRERAMIFMAAAFVLISLFNTFFLDPLLLKEQALSQKVVQDQLKMKAQQATIQASIDAKRDAQNSPLHQRVAQLREQLQEQKQYLSHRSDRLVSPAQIPLVLEQVLKQQSQLQLLKLETLPLAPLIEDKPANDGTVVAQSQTTLSGGVQQQIFKHGVRITVRGSYLDLLRYLTALENLPTQMFWGEVVYKVDEYPNAVMSLTLFTLSLDTIWLTV